MSGERSCRRRTARRAGIASRAALAACVAAAAVASSGTHGASAVEPSPIEVFEKFIRDREPSVRRKAVGQLSGVRGPAVVGALMTALDDEDRTVRDKAETVLLELRDRADEIDALRRAASGKASGEARAVAVRALALHGGKTADAVRALIADRAGPVRIAAARAMASVGDRASAPLLHEMLTSKEAVVRAEAVEAIAAVLGAESVGTASAVALGDGAAEPRVAAVRVLGRYPSADGLPRVERCLRDESWSLRVASAEAMAEHGIGDEPARAAAKALVEALAREDRRRVKLALGEALWGLTGIDFGPEPDRWKKWQAEALAGFRPPPRRPVRAQHGAAGSTSGGILDLPIDSEHVCFVLDASSSMNDAVRFGAETTKRAALLAAFGKVLQGLPKPSWINLIPFGTEPMPMKPRLFEATEGGRSAAVKYLGKVTFDGRTNIHDALMLALADDDADTVVLLTDGAPSAGRSTSRTGILDAIRDANRWRLARVHAVELGAANTGARWKGFMEEIARATGGVHLSR